MSEQEITCRIDDCDSKDISPSKLAWSDFICRTCEAKRVKAYYAKNKDKIRAKRRESYKKKKFDWDRKVTMVGDRRIDKD